MSSFSNSPVYQKEERPKFGVAAYIIATLVFLTIHFLAKAGVFDGIESISFKGLTSLLEKWAITLAVVSFILMIRTILEKLISNLDQTQGERYNLSRITRLIASVLIVYVVLASLFVNPYKSLAGLGIASLILGFALQAPITSFISWLYIVFRRPYQVGDRIQINDHKGDVIEINYLDTIIEEFSGDYLKNDRKSGRLIYFPNSKILTDRIINYDGPERPFIWNETSFQIAFTSNLEFVEKCLKNVAEKDFEQEHPEFFKHAQGDWESAVYFRVNEYAWLEAVISYPVLPLETTNKRNRILKKALSEMNAQPDLVQFPEGRFR